MQVGGDDECKRLLRAILTRMRATNYRPTVEELGVLHACERRAVYTGLGAGTAVAAATVLATRGLRGGLLGTAVRYTLVMGAGATGAFVGAAHTGDACLADLLHIAPHSPLGGEAVRILMDVNPGSPLLQHCPRAARWEPDALPRLPQPVNNAAVRAHAAAAAAAAPAAAKRREEAADGWGASGETQSVFDSLLGGPTAAPAPASAAGQLRPRRPQRPYEDAS